MSTKAATSSSPAAGSRLWILDPWRDLALFVLAPLWIVPLVWLAKSNFEFATFGAVVLALGGVGHHLPGFIRAYTDPVLFRRFRTRFTVAPLVLLAVFAFFSLNHLHGLRLIAVAWGAWHGAMQINGFLRIYDSKAGSISPSTAKLDWAMCLAWFGAGLFHSNSRVAAILMNFYDSGAPLVDPGLFSAFRVAWDLATVGVTIAFAFNAWKQWRAGVKPSPIKFLLMASSFGFFWFAMVAVNEPILGLLLFELFHDIQYNALVWAYNRQRVAKGLNAGPMEDFLFRPGAVRVALYAALVLGYGIIGVFTGYSAAMAPKLLGVSSGPTEFWTGIFMVSAFLHFYYDSFIWQVREKELRKGLGIGGQKQEKPSAETPGRGWLPTGWKWALFAVAVVSLGAMELRGNASRVPLARQYRSVVEITPSNWMLYSVLGDLERVDKDFVRSAMDYESALALNPDFEPAHAMLADIEAHAGRYDLALPHYRRAMELDSLDYTNRAHLAIALVMTDRVAEALPHLLVEAKRSPTDTAVVYLTGAALVQENRPQEAVPYLESTLRLNPRQPRAWSYLAVAERLLGDTAASAAYYQRAYALDPANAWR
jgi:Tfp pilus assembly protein PilF